MFEYYIADGKHHLKYAQGKPAVVGREFHSYDEIVLFIEGNAQLVSKNIQIQLTPGSIIFIPKEQFHQFVVTDNEKYQRCILGFEETPELQQLVREILTEVIVLPNPSGRMHGIFRTLMQAVQKELSENEQRLLLQASVIQLLLLYKLSEAESIRKYVTVSSVTQTVLNYIDSHLQRELKLSKIAEELGVSVSTLSHRFRHDLNISVYRYISEKRLSVVRQYMEQGVPLGIAAARSGFKDYSGFFRLYRKYYGEAPSASANTSVVLNQHL